MTLKAKFTFLLVVFLVCLNGNSIASTQSDIKNALNEAMAFSNMFPPGTNRVTEGQHRKAEKHLVNALGYGRKPNRSQLEKSFDAKFAYEWSAFMTAITNRLDGWRTANQSKSIEGINGIERFRNYYNSNSTWINKRLKGENGTSWFIWNPKKGDLIPKIGCDKGAVIAWLAGC